MLAEGAVASLASRETRLHLQHGCASTRCPTLVEARLSILVQFLQVPSPIAASTVGRPSEIVDRVTFRVEKALKNKIELLVNAPLVGS